MLLISNVQAFQARNNQDNYRNLHLDVVRVPIESTVLQLLTADQFGELVWIVLAEKHAIDMEFARLLPQLLEKLLKRVSGEFF